MAVSKLVPSFREIWCVDFEYQALPGERPNPHCLVAYEILSGRYIRLWRDEFGSKPPYALDEDSLFVAYAAEAEMSCHLALGWQLPSRVLDLYAEFRRLRSGLFTECGYSLLGALAFHGLDHMDAEEKEEMRKLSIRGGPFTDKEKVELLDYCQADVDALPKLLDAMLRNLDLQPATRLRGRYGTTVAIINYNGIPMDVEGYYTLLPRWDDMQLKLIRAVDAKYGVYAEDGSFNFKRFEQLLARRGIPWPRTPTGRLRSDDKTFRDAARAYSFLADLQELKATVGKFRLSGLAIGKDGRNRGSLKPFGTVTCRNAPKHDYIFCPATWLRGFIKPQSGYGIAYVDYEQQEFGIAAALSNDPAMMAAYQSGDPYLAFAKLAGAVPQDGTRKDYEAVRDRFKQCELGLQYGMTAEGLALRLGVSVFEAQALVEAKARAFPRFKEWSNAAVDSGLQRGRLFTPFGWQINVDSKTKWRTLANFPMQGTGSEVTMIACILTTERGVELCGSVHDALLINSPLDRLEEDIKTTQECMEAASKIVLNGFKLRTDVKRVIYPNRYMDKRGEGMWNRVWETFERLERKAA